MKHLTIPHKFEKLLDLCRHNIKNYDGDYLNKHYQYEGDGNYKTTDLSVIHAFIKDYRKGECHSHRLEACNELWEYLHTL